MLMASVLSSGTIVSMQKMIQFLPDNHASVLESQKPEDMQVFFPSETQLDKRFKTSDYLYFNLKTKISIELSNKQFSLAQLNEIINLAVNIYSLDILNCRHDNTTKADVATILLLHNKKALIAFQKQFLPPATTAKL